MKVLLLGVGMQGKAALHFLMHHDTVSEVVAADADLVGLEGHARAMGYERVSARSLDAADPDSIAELLGSGVDVAIDLLPPRFAETVARSAVARGVHLVNALFVSPGLARLGARAVANGVSIIPECGLDPGLDLILLGEAARGWDSIDEIVSYGAGVPEPAAADNPLKYKVSWTFQGVLDSYHRAGTVIEDGRVVPVPADEMFAPANVHTVDIAGVGTLEAFPNGDVVEYVRRLGIEVAGLRRAGRYSMRWPGHAAFWKDLVDLGLLDDDPVTVAGMEVHRRAFLAEALGPRLAYGPGERDVAIVRVEVAGSRGGRPGRSTWEVVDRRDLATGILAMGRTTGYTAAIVATLIGTSRITKRGLLSPLIDVPFGPFLDELARVGIEVRRTS